MNSKISSGLLKFYSFVRNVVSFSPKYRPYTFLTILVGLLLIPVSLLEKTPNLSICSRVLGDYCYSVGITRGVSSLLKGNFQQAIDYNFLAVPVLLILIIFIVVDFYYKKKKSL